MLIKKKACKTKNQWTKQNNRIDLKKRDNKDMDRNQLNGKLR